MGEEEGANDRVYGSGNVGQVLRDAKGETVAKDLGIQLTGDHSWN